MEKKCSKCRKVRLVADFGKRTDAADGLQAWCRPCMSEASRARREAKADEVRAYGAAYRKANPELCKSATLRWRERNRERVAAQKAAWAARNPDKIRESRERNAVAKAAGLAAWKAANREKVREYQRKRRVAGYGGSLRGIDTEGLWAKGGGLCPLCGDVIDRSLSWPDRYSASLDHIVPLSRGGEHSDENCQWVHLRCNMSKNNR